MTQPDLVSKLSTKLPDLAAPTLNENFILAAIEKYQREVKCAGWLARTCWHAGAIQGKALAGREVQPSPSTPIVPSTPDDPRFNGVVEELVEEFAILDEDIPALRQILARLQPALGLSAEQIASVVAANKLLPDPPGGYDMEGIAKDLNALLGAAKPAEPSISSGEIVAHDKYVALKTEAQIRKDVLREAFLLRPGLPHEWNSTQFKEGYYAGLEVFRQAIEKAIAAERPAPAGEARISRWQCPHCAHVNSMISANCENCKIPLVNTAR